MNVILLWIIIPESSLKKSIKKQILSKSHNKESLSSPGRPLNQPVSMPNGSWPLHIEMWIDYSGIHRAHGRTTKWNVNPTDTADTEKPLGYNVLECLFTCYSLARREPAAFVGIILEDKYLAGIWCKYEQNTIQQKKVRLSRIPFFG